MPDLLYLRSLGSRLLRLTDRRAEKDMIALNLIGALIEVIGFVRLGGIVIVTNLP